MIKCRSYTRISVLDSAIETFYGRGKNNFFADLGAVPG